MVRWICTCCHSIFQPQLHVLGFLAVALTKGEAWGTRIHYISHYCQRFWHYSNDVFLRQCLRHILSAQHRTAGVSPGKERVYTRSGAWSCSDLSITDTLLGCAAIPLLQDDKPIRQQCGTCKDNQDFAKLGAISCDAVITNSPSSKALSNLRYITCASSWNLIYVRSPQTWSFIFNQ